MRGQKGLNSILCQQQRSSVFSAHLDPDHYGAYGEPLADFVSGNGNASRDELVRWFHEFSNAQVPLIFFVFGWQHNFLEALQRNRNDSRLHSPTNLAIVLSSLVQF